MRDYWRGQVDGVDELATRLSGSADLFDHDDRPPSSSINFFDAHDGFPLRDLVTYNEKHNEANGEDNRDGSDDNRSWNCGVEGETADEVINALRHRQIRNMVATLMLSDGVPMYCAGDEMGRTQQGNNNAYCQDGPINWLRWDQMEEWGDVLDTVRTFTDLRMSTPLLHANDYRYRTEVTDPAGAGLGRYELAWMNGSSGEMGEADWHDGSRRLLGMYVSDASSVAYLSWFYSGDQPSRCRCHPRPGERASTSCVDLRRRRGARCRPGSRRFVHDAAPNRGDDARRRDDHGAGSRRSASHRSGDRYRGSAYPGHTGGRGPHQLVSAAQSPRADPVQALRTRQPPRCG